MNNIKVFKLISGEELIAEVVTQLRDRYQVKSPATIVLQQTQSGVGVALMPYMPYAAGNVEISAHAVASEAEPDTRMVNEYSRIFGSGIEIVSALDVK